MFHNVSAYKQSKEAIAMNRQFDFLMPSVNFFGPGVIEKIGDRAKMLGMHKVLVVTQDNLAAIDNGPVKQTLASLEKAGVDYAALVLNLTQRFGTSRLVRRCTKMKVVTQSSLLVVDQLMTVVRESELF